MNTELVKFQNTSGLYLDGLYYSVPEAKIAVIHIHGSFGNFYSNDFLKVMAKHYTSKNINFLTFNLTQHDGIAEAVREINGQDTWVDVGYSVSDYNECIHDINGAINFVLSKGNQDIILQGHSLGCNRALYYLSQSDVKYDTILLSPTNSKHIQEIWISPESLDHQIQRLKADSDKRSISFSEHGVHSPNSSIDETSDTDPYIPVSKEALLTLLENPSLDIINFVDNLPVIDINLFAYFGGKDEYQTLPISTYIDGYKKHFTNFQKLVIEDGTHGFLNDEEIVASEIASWILHNKAKK